MTPGSPPTPQRFTDRRHAGRILAGDLIALRDEQPIVLALPRGGVPVGFEVAAALGAPLDLLVVRKLGAPLNPELAVGAIAEHGGGALDQVTARRLGLTRQELDATIARETAELRRRVARYRGGRAAADVRGRTVILVDDGLATGLSDLAAVRDARAMGARRVIVAVPVGAGESVTMLGQEADAVICHTIPTDLRAVGLWYEDFSEVGDEEVLGLLAAAGTEAAAPAGGERSVRIAAGTVELDGDLVVPAGARGLVIFVHGSGSSRHSPRNREVAAVLHRSGFATLLFDLLTMQEGGRRELVFDIDLLAGRLAAVTRWALGDPQVGGLPIGYFGASTGAAAALRAAAALGDTVRAVVSRGGRPDLAEGDLDRVHAPTLLLVGSRDPQVLELNRRAARHLAGPHEIRSVRGATHLFEEPGALEAVADQAAQWFASHLTATPAEVVP